MTTYSSNRNSRMGKIDTVSCREQGTSTLAAVKVFFINAALLIGAIVTAWVLTH